MAYVLSKNIHLTRNVHLSTNAVGMECEANITKAPSSLHKGVKWTEFIRNCMTMNKQELYGQCIFKLSSSPMIPSLHHVLLSIVSSTKSPFLSTLGSTAWHIHIQFTC